MHTPPSSAPSTGSIRQARGSTAALDVLADVLTDASLPEAEYESEQEVIRREFAMGFDDPERSHSELLFKTVFRTHPYGQPVIGHLDIFNQLTTDDVVDLLPGALCP